MNTPGNIHDAFFRDAMSRKEVAADFLRQYLPSAVTRHLALDTLAIAKDSFVSDDQSRHYSDLLYDVKLNGGDHGLVYFLFEHKSFHDRFVALQLLRYMVEIWELRRKQGKAGDRLPLIIPVVVYHGKTKRESTRLADLVAAPDARCAAFVPDFDMAFRDFSPEAETEIKGTLELRLLCSCLQAKNDPTSVRRVMEIFALLSDLGDDACALQWVATIYRYLAGTMDIEAEVVQDIAQQTLSMSKRDTVMTLAERLHHKGMLEGQQQGIKQGMQQGMQQGMLQGMQQGLLEGRQKVLQRLMAKRFGDNVLDIEVQGRLRSATQEELDTWAERILDAATIDDIFTEPRSGD